MPRHTILADGRWLAADGIGRFARELRQRGPASCDWLGGGPRAASPWSPFWLSLRLRTRRKAVFFSPGFVPPLTTRNSLVFTIHDLIHLKADGETGVLKRCFYDRIIRPAARKAFRILTLSEHSKQELVAWTGLPAERVVVVGVGVSPDFTPEGPRVERPRPFLLYVGNRKPHKNVDRLLQAYDVSGLAEGYDLVLSGKPDEELRAKLQNPAARTGLYFAGFIPEAELPAYYRTAAAVVIPSLHEGFGLPALEALACATPVVASGTGALGEVVRGAGILVDPLDVESIAQGMRDAVAQTPQAGMYREAGLSRAAGFTWDRTAQLAWQVVDQAVQS